MAKLRYNTSIGVDSMNSDGTTNVGTFDLSRPSTWAFIWWILSIAFLLFIYLSL